MNKSINYDIYAAACVVKVEGEPLPHDAVISVSVDENLESPGKFDITLNEYMDPGTQEFKWLDNEFLNPGRKVEINFGYGESNENLMMGIIKALSPGFPSSGVPTLTVEGYDPSIQMQKRMTSLNLENKKYSDIAAQIAKEYHLNSDGIEDSGKKHKKVNKQKDEKDFKLLQRLAQEIDFEFFVRSNTLYFRKPKDTGIMKIYSFRKNFISFSPRLSMTSLIKEVVVTGWDSKKNKIKEKVTLDDLSMDADVSALLNKFIAASEGDEPKKVEKKAVDSKEKAKQIAEAEMIKTLNTFIQGDLECVGEPTLRPGTPVKIEGIGKIFSGIYYITSAKHSFGDGGYTTTIGVRRKIL